MPAKTKTPKTQIAAEFDTFGKDMTRRLTYLLKRVGEECVNEARQKHSYLDQTGNLTSSFGFLIAVDGKVVFEEFDGGDVKREKGMSAGIRLAHDAVKNYPHDVVLILVAGMEYASYVANRGYDVLDSAELLAKKIAPKYLKLVWK